MVSIVQPYAAENLILDGISSHLQQILVTDIDPEDPTLVTELRPGKLQDNPTNDNGLNILIIPPNEQDPITIYTHNVQNGLTGPTYEIGGGVMFYHPYRLRLLLHFRGITDRAIARTRAMIVLARAKKALLDMPIPLHPDTLQPKDDFGQTIIEIQLDKAWVEEGGGTNHFIWKGWVFFGFLTEQENRIFE